MAILRFPEVVATNGNDVLFAGNNQLTFSLNGNDRVTARVGSEYNFMAGGAGDDIYVTANNSAITIVDTGGDDTLVATGLGINNPYTFVATVEGGQHIIAVDLVSGQQVAVANWTDPESRIERFQLAEGVFTFNEVTSAIADSSNFLGDLSTADLVREGLLPSGTTSSDLQEFVDYVMVREATLLDTRATLEQSGVGWDEARSYVFDHLDAPEQIFTAANAVGLSADMLASLVGVQQHQVVDYFGQHGLDATALG